MDLISRQDAYKVLSNIHRSTEEQIMLKNALDRVPTRKPLTQQDYQELNDRFGDFVEFVVRDMIEGREERWG